MPCSKRISTDLINVNGTECPSPIPAVQFSKSEIQNFLTVSKLYFVSVSKPPQRDSLHPDRIKHISILKFKGVSFSSTRRSNNKFKTYANTCLLLYRHGWYFKCCKEVKCRFWWQRVTLLPDIEIPNRLMTFSGWKIFVLYKSYFLCYFSGAREN